MNKLLDLIRRDVASWLVTYPAIIVSIVTGLAHLDKAQAGYAAALVMAAGTLVTMFRTRPWHVALAAGVAGDLIQGLLLFNLHVSSADRAAIIALVGLLTGHVAMRPNLTPRTRA